MYESSKTVFALVDVQGKLAQIMYQKERLFENLGKLISGMQVLGVPIIWVEQTPKKMGRTIAPLREQLKGASPISKSSFGCCGEPRFIRALADLGRRQVLVAGIETHVCVYQTAAGLVSAGYEVQVVADAVSSRTPRNREIGLEKIKACGAGLTSVEAALFELLGSAEHAAFREILAIVK